MYILNIYTCIYTIPEVAHAITDTLDRKYNTKAYHKASHCTGTQHMRGILFVGILYS